MDPVEFILKVVDLYCALSNEYKQWARMAISLLMNTATLPSEVRKEIIDKMAKCQQ